MASNKSAVQKESTKKQQGSKSGKSSKRVPPISTDAALFTSTAFAFFLTAPDSSVIREAISIFGNNPQGKAETSQDSIKAFYEATKPVFEKAIASSCDKAAELLAFVLYLESICRKLDPKDPKRIVTFFYCFIRLADRQKEFEEIKKLAINAYGKNWQWPLAWDMALENEIVKRRWEDEEARGTLFRIGWEDECKKFANNFWATRKREYENVKVQKAKMISSLHRKLGLTNPSAKKPS